MKKRKKDGKKKKKKKNNCLETKNLIELQAFGSIWKTEVYEFRENE
jgi:hypothetical protein